MEQARRWNIDSGRQGKARESSPTRPNSTPFHQQRLLRWLARLPMAWSRERALLYCLIAPLLLVAVFTAGSSLLRPVIWHFQGLSSSSLPAKSSLSSSSSVSSQKVVSIDEIGSLMSTDPAASESKVRQGREIVYMNCVCGDRVMLFLLWV